MADKKLSSAEARAVRNSSLSDLIASKLMTNESIGEALKLAIDQKIQGHAKGMKEKFNILFIAKVLTGGKIDTRILANILGLNMDETGKGKKVKKEKVSEVNDTNIKSTEQLKQETEEKEKAKRIREGEEESQDVQKTLKVKQTGRATRVRKGDSVSDVLSKIYTILQDSFDKKKLDKELEDDFRQQRKVDDERRHKEFLDALRKAFRSIVEENEKNLKELANNMGGGGGNPIWNFIKDSLEDILLYRFLRNLLKRFPKGLPSIPEVKPPVTEPVPRLPAPETPSAPSGTKALPAPEPTSAAPTGTKALPAPERTPALPSKGAPVLEPPVSATANAPKLTPAPTGGTTIEMGKGTTGSYTEVKGFSTATPRPTVASSKVGVTATRILTPLEEFSPGIALVSRTLGIASEAAGPLLAALQVYSKVKQVKNENEYLDKSLEYAALTGDTKPLLKAVTIIEEVAHQDQIEAASYTTGAAEKIPEMEMDWELSKDEKIKTSLEQELKKIPKLREQLKLKAVAIAKQKADKAASDEASAKAADVVKKMDIPFLRPVTPDFIGKYINDRSKENEDMLTAPRSKDNPSTSAVVQNNTSGSTQQITELTPASPVNDESTKNRTVKSSTRRY